MDWKREGLPSCPAVTYNEMIIHKGVRMNRGLFFSFEGNDGSGKTTQIRKLKQWFEEQGREVVWLREPGGTPIGEKIRALVLGRENSEMSAVTEMLLYAASRAQLVREVVVPALERGSVVLCDRFVHSSLAYQGYGRELGKALVWSVNAPAVDGHMPDLTFFMDIDADSAMSRRNASGEDADRLETEHMNFHRRVYDGYDHLAEEDPERIRRICGKRDPEAIFANIRAAVETLLL